MAYGAKGARAGSKIHPIGAVAGAKAGAVRGAFDDEWVKNNGHFSGMRSEGKQGFDDIDW